MEKKEDTGNFKYFLKQTWHVTFCRENIYIALLAASIHATSLEKILQLFVMFIDT